MTPQERWRRVQQLYEQVEPLPAAARGAELLKLEPGLAGEVAKLFEAVEREQSTGRQYRSSEDQVLPAPELPGLRLLDRIGTGGSGVVYRAVRLVEGAEQTVAVKVLHEHRVDVNDLKRFAREREIMAALNHPGVVHFLDAGVAADGRPFLVMELAEGSPITTYCDRQRLSVANRVRLAIEVCQTVAAAHARLIVHLDLKPSNILVTEEGTEEGKVKLLDLGTARLLDPDHVSTLTEQMTPQYASPEQLRAEPPSVANDVYSLGVILFELLSGGWPFALRDSVVGLAERATGTAEALSLSGGCTPDAALARDTTITRLRGALAGDLSLICQKALAFDLKQRYQTVTELAEDLRRHMDGEPVWAHPPGFLYRAGKFARRYRAQLLLGFVAVAGLAGAAVYSTMQARRAESALDEADTALTAMVGSLSAVVVPPEATHREYVKRMYAAIPELTRDNPLQRVYLQAFAAVEFLNQQEFSLARESAEQATAIAEAYKDPYLKTASLLVLAQVELRLNRPEASGQAAHRALEVWRANPSAFTRLRAGRALSQAGRILVNVKPYDAEAGWANEACLEVAPRGMAALAEVRLDCLEGAARAMFISNRYAEAVTLLSEAAAFSRAQGRRAALALALTSLGLAHRLQGNFAQDEACQREATEIRAALYGADTLFTANFRAPWAFSLAGIGQPERGLQEAERAVAVYRKIYPKRAENLLWSPLSAAAANACLLQKYEQCVEYAREALEALGPKPHPKDQRVATGQGWLGLGLARLGQVGEAKPLLESALAAYRDQQRRPIGVALMEAELAGTK